MQHCTCTKSKKLHKKINLLFFSTLNVSLVQLKDFSICYQQNQSFFIFNSSRYNCIVSCAYFNIVIIIHNKYTSLNTYNPQYNYFTFLSFAETLRINR